MRIPAYFSMRCAKNVDFRGVDFFEKKARRRKSKRAKVLVFRGSARWYVYSVERHCGGGALCRVYFGLSNVYNVINPGGGGGVGGRRIYIQRENPLLWKAGFPYCGRRVLVRAPYSGIFFKNRPTFVGFVLRSQDELGAGVEIYRYSNSRCTEKVAGRFARFGLLPY